MITNSDRPTGRRTLQDDLLADLRKAAPVPVTAPPAPRPAPRPAATAETKAASAESTAASVELRVTPRRWSRLRAQSLPGRSGVRIAVGPLQVSLTR